ncbi:MAG: zinc ribbon domain-containing protein [Candidatus Hodarchaeales archaeon]|jgi:hypothetical protein
MEIHVMCQNCGEATTKNFLYCKKCGADLRQRRCEHCGASANRKRDFSFFGTTFYYCSLSCMIREHWLYTFIFGIILFSLRFLARATPNERSGSEASNYIKDIPFLLLIIDFISLLGLVFVFIGLLAFLLRIIAPKRFELEG